MADFLGVNISHADRVVFPDAGCTKGDVAAYYARVGERMLELAGRRAVSLLRCPQGRDGDCFFQKHAGKGFPAQIDTVRITEASGGSEAYMEIRQKAGFVAAAQMGAIEFHIWGSRTDRLEKPDRLVFDLDPDEGLAFGDVRQAAFELRDFLAGTGLESHALVTGGKGVHVVIALRRTVEWETATGFCRTVAAHFASAFPDRYVDTMSKQKRKGRIFIDWLRNQRGNTAIAPWSVRARPGAPVAVPLEWGDLAALKAANEFSMGDAMARLDRPCPLCEAEKQSLSASVIEALEAAVTAQA
ncbi:MAG: non-homologous end-joining DNA ligase [Zhengella sp.]